MRKLSLPLLAFVFFTACGGTDHLGLSKYTVPDIAYDTFDKVKAHSDTLNEQRRARFYKLDRDSKKWGAESIKQTCDCLRGFDIDFALNDDYVKWVMVAEISYDLGVETPEEEKLLAYNEILQIYISMAEKGTIRDPKSPWRAEGFRLFSYASIEPFLAGIDDQCGDLRKKILEIENIYTSRIKYHEYF